jgi:hypothetical protein
MLPSRPLLFPWLLLLGACASAPRAPVENDGRLCETVSDAAHVRIAVAADRPAVAAARSVALAPVTWPAASASEAIDGEQLDLVGNRAARAACRELARWFELPENAEHADIVLTLELAEVRPSNRLAAGASALADVFVPGPFRLPVGLGGLSARATGMAADATVFDYRWARGARALAEGASVSTIGDAWQLAALFGRDAARELAHQRAPKADRRPQLAEDRRTASRAWCDARYGKVPLAARGAARIIPLAPEAIDAGAPDAHETPDAPAEPPQ